MSLIACHLQYNYVHHEYIIRLVINVVTVLLRHCVYIMTVEENEWLKNDVAKMTKNS